MPSSQPEKAIPLPNVFFSYVCVEDGAVMQSPAQQLIRQTSGMLRHCQIQATGSSDWSVFGAPLLGRSGAH